MYKYRDGSLCSLQSLWVLLEVARGQCRLDARCNREAEGLLLQAQVPLASVESGARGRLRLSLSSTRGLSAGLAVPSGH